MANQNITTSKLRPHQATQKIKGYELQISHELEDRAWDAFLVRARGGHHVQTSLWAQVKASLGWGVVRLTITQKGQIVAGAQILRRKVPLIGEIGYVPKGPLLAVDDPQLTELMIEKLQHLARTYRILYLIVQPPEDKGIIQTLAQRGFRPSTRNVVPTATITIDLAKGLDEILAKMRKKTRYGIRRGKREGIVIREGAEEDLDSFYDIMLATAGRRQFSIYPRSYYAKMWRVFHPHGYIKMLLAEYQGEVVSAHVVIPFGDTLLAKMGYWSGRYGQFRPNELLEWEMIKWAKAQGFRHYDFEGIDPKAAKIIHRGDALPDSLQQTPTSFKVGFSQNVVFFPEAYAYIYNPLMRWFYNSFHGRILKSKKLKKLMHWLRTH